MKAGNKRKKKKELSDIPADVVKPASLRYTKSRLLRIMNDRIQTPKSVVVTADAMKALHAVFKQTDVTEVFEDDDEYNDFLHRIVTEVEESGKRGECVGRWVRPKHVLAVLKKMISEGKPVVIGDLPASASGTMAGRKRSRRQGRHT